jgi:hypothetical protein
MGLKSKASKKKARTPVGVVAKPAPIAARLAAHEAAIAAATQVRCDRICTMLGISLTHIAFCCRIKLVWKSLK